MYVLLVRSYLSTQHHACYFKGIFLAQLLDNGHIHSGQLVIEENGGAGPQVPPIPGLQLPSLPLTAEGVGQLLGGAALAIVTNLNKSSEVWLDQKTKYSPLF